MLLYLFQVAIQNQPVPCQKNHHQPSTQSYATIQSTIIVSIFLTVSSVIRAGCDTTLLHIQSFSTLEKNFAAQLVRHFFTPQELYGRNFRGIRNKLPLDLDKLQKIKEIIFRFYPPMTCCGTNAAKLLTVSYGDTGYLEH